MSATSDFLENKIMDHVLNVTPYSPTQLYLALFTAGSNLEVGDIPTEISEGGYERQPITFGAAISGISVANNHIEFGPATAHWGNISHFAIMDSFTGGNVLFHEALVDVKFIETDDILKLPVGTVRLTIT